MNVFFILRLLLYNVPGPTSYDDLKTFDGVLYATFEDVCRARELLIEDSQWADTLEEAVVTAGAKQLRELFCIIIVYCTPMNP